MGTHLSGISFRKRGTLWFYKLPGEPYRSSGETSRSRCEKHVESLLLSRKLYDQDCLEFHQYAMRFFVWETCPHTARLLDEGKSISRRYVREQRMNMEKHILPSALQNIPMDEIRRSHIIDFRSSLRSKGLAAATVNKIMSALKVIFNEAEYRQDIQYNPAKAVGKIRGAARSIDIFSPEELRMLFPRDLLSVWRNRMEYTCFFLAASTGMRRGEILALRWRHIRFEKHFISIEEAWKDFHEIGMPKWDKSRVVCLSLSLHAALTAYREASVNTNEGDLVFCYRDGSRLGGTWWRGSFRRALTKSGIPIGNRVLHPHCLRHSLTTMLRDAGEHPEKIRAALGWTSEEMQENYTHWNIEHLRQQGPIIDDIWKDEQEEYR